MYYAQKIISPNSRALQNFFITHFSTPLSPTVKSPYLYGMEEIQVKPARPLKFNKDGSIVSEEQLLEAARIAEIRKENRTRPIAKLNKGDLWKSMGDYLITTGMEDLLDALNTLKETDPKGFISEYTKILKFFKPSMQSQSITADTSIEIKLVDAREEAIKEGYLKAEEVTTGEVIEAETTEATTAEGNE